MIYYDETFYAYSPLNISPLDETKILYSVKNVKLVGCNFFWEKRYKGKRNKKFKHLLKLYSSLDNY